MHYDEHCQQFEAEGARFVARAAVAEVDAPVPGCPDWRVFDLLQHVGLVHRWASHLVAVRAPERLSARDMGLSRGPVSAAWLAEGVGEALATLRASSPDVDMWAWGADQHVRFWARRLLHETLVHRVDLEDAMGVTSPIESSIAVDAIDEFLENLTCAGAFSPGVKNLTGSDDVLTFRTDEGPAWGLRLTPHGFAVLEDSPPSDAVLRGPATDLLLTLYRRRTLHESACVTEGRRDLVTAWLANCALQ